MPSLPQSPPLRRARSARRPLTALALALIPALLLPVAAVPAAADQVPRSACFEDTADDTVTQAERRSTDTPEADIVSWCVGIDAQVLSLRLDVRTPTDPARDARWADQGAAAALRLTAADGTPVVVNLVRPRGADGLQMHATTDERVPSTLCQGPATTTATGWGADVPVNGCFAQVGGLPSTLEVATSVHWALEDDNSGSGVVDLAPNAGTYSVSRLAGDDRGVDRFAGEERIATSIKVSLASFPDGAASAVVLARADVFADAVVAAPLAVAADAPVLLTRQSSVPAEVMLELERVLGGAGEVVLLGGAAAIRSSVVAQLAAEGHRVTRLDGETRFATAARIAEEASARTGTAPQIVMLADGSRFGEALVAGAAAPQLGGVVVLTDGDRMPEATRAFLGANADVPTLTVGRQAQLALPESTSVAGATPEITSVLLAEHLARRIPAFGDEVVLASAERFPDGLAGGAWAARRGAPLLLSPRDALVTAVAEHLEDEGPYDAVVLLGGPSALSPAVGGQVAAHLR